MDSWAAARSKKAARWRNAYWKNQEKVTNDLDQISVAADFFRLVVKRCTTPEQRAQVIATAVADLVAPAEELLTRYERKG